MKKIFLLIAAVFTALSVTILSANTAYAATGSVSIKDGRYGSEILSATSGTIRLSVDSNFTVYLNGVPFGHQMYDGIEEGGYSVHITGVKVILSGARYGELIGEYTSGVLSLGSDNPFTIKHNNTIVEYRAEVEEDDAGYLIEIVPLVDSRPAISGQENFVTSVDDAKDLSFFKGFISAIDDVDGNITGSIYVVTDNYTTNKSVLGTYSVVFGVKDSSNNESTLEVFITVADVTKPVITGNATKVQISYTQTWNISNFKATLAVTDNYASLTNTNITVKSDGYTSKKTDLGTYNVVFAAVDPSGNEGTFTKQVEVIDDIAPVFSGPTTLTKPVSSILTINEIKAQLTATDAKEGNRTTSITVKSDNYTGNGNKVGSYDITFEVKDSKGNTATHVITVRVSDSIPPIWYIQDGVSVKLVPPATLTRQQIIDLLVNTGQLNVGATTQVNFLVDEYTGNEHLAGVYMMSIGYSDTAGNEGIHTLAITVLEDEQTNPIIVDPIEDFDFVGFMTSPLGLGVIAIVLVGLLIFLNKRKK